MGGLLTPRPDRFTPGKVRRYPLYRRLGGPQGRSGRVRKISSPPGFDPRTAQPVAIRYTDWAIPAPARENKICNLNTVFWRVIVLNSRSTFIRIYDILFPGSVYECTPTGRINAGWLRKKMDSNSPENWRSLKMGYVLLQLMMMMMMMMMIMMKKPLSVHNLWSILCRYVLQTTLLIIPVSILKGGKIDRRQV